MIEKPPVWKEHLNIELLEKSLKQEDFIDLTQKIKREYSYWDKLKHYPMPKGFIPEQLWSVVKFSRISQYENTPILNDKGDSFVFSMTNSLYQRLNYIDTYSAGFIKTFGDKPTSTQSAKLMMSNLSEEAIATSQIEGANTSRKVAKEMLLSQRKPRTEGEQMIINSYKLMQQLDIWKDLELSESLLIDIQKIITDQTLSDADGRGRFRNDEDDIVVSDPITGEIAHTPMKEEKMKSELKRLIKFANNEEGEDFIHPVIKATILHFWLSYLHPFVDGNGRTARALFYWYLKKKGYWLIKYISVSRAIVSSRKQYDRAFLESELDENDLTYFILYITKSFERSIKVFIEYLEKKIKEEKELEKIADKLDHFNERQIALLRSFKENPNSQTDVEVHKNKHLISRPTAHNDLTFLAKRGLLTSIKKSRKKIFVPNHNEINKILPA